MKPLEGEEGVSRISRILVLVLQFIHRAGVACALEKTVIIGYSYREKGQGGLLHANGKPVHWKRGEDG